jgi:hypothetical protein
VREEETVYRRFRVFQYIISLAGAAIISPTYFARVVVVEHPLVEWSIRVIVFVAFFAILGVLAPRKKTDDRK